MSLDFRHASIVEGVRFTAQVGVPNVVLGLFAKRPLPTRVAATAHADDLAYLLVQGLVKKYGPDPFWVRVAREEALLVHHPDDIRIVLGGSPEPFASDPDAKRKGMAAFQPDALTISRSPLWQNRRAFAEAVLDTSQQLHRLAPGFLAVVDEEVERLGAQPALDWAVVNAAFQRITRRIVFGDSAVDDESVSAELGELMAAGNKMPGKPADGYDTFLHRVQTYVDAGEIGSLCSLVADAPSDGDTQVAGQLIHWLFAMGDTLAANAFRALAVLATHPLQLAEVRAELDGVDLTEPKSVVSVDYLSGCLADTMRLWPTTALFGRVATQDVRFPNGQLLPAGSQVLIHNLFNHRNRARVPFADRFAPEEWASGTAGQDWTFNFFSHGPQGCPGANLAMLVGTAFLAGVLDRFEPRLSGANLDPGKPLPHGLDIYGLSVRLTPRS